MSVVLIAFVLSLFAGRLVQLQWIDAEAYADQASSQRLVRMTLPATRGTITDSSGEPLALTVDARTVYADPSLVEERRMDEIASALAPLLEVPEAQIRDKLDAPGQFVDLARGVPPDEARQVVALGYRGIATQPDHQRVYPAGKLAANLVGTVGRDGNGLAGIEYAMEELLAGRDGRQTVELGGNGQPIPMASDRRHAPVPGSDVHLTIERDVQWKAEGLIERQVAATGADSGSVVVMDPRTGEILALATHPSFDPNQPGEAAPGNIRNRAVTDVFEPGSTNKVITTAAALEATDLTPRSAFTVPYTLRRAGTTFRDSHAHPTQRLTLAGVLATSSNIGTLLAAERVGARQLYRFMRDFGFGQPTGLEFPGESAGLLPPVEDWSATKRYTVAFGQGVSVNAVQMVSVYAAIANGGTRVEPNLVAGTTDETGQYERAPAPGRHRVVSERTARQLTRMLEAAVSDDGTAPQAQIPGYRVAGKTGTAKRVDPDCGCYRGYTATFVGFAPAEYPRLVVEVVLQDPKRGHYGGEVAAPVFQDVMSFALKRHGVPPSETKPPEIRLHADR